MKILIVDDHVLIREALRGVLKELKGEAVILEAPDSRQAMRAESSENPDHGADLARSELAGSGAVSRCSANCANAIRRIRGRALGQR